MFRRMRWVASLSLAAVISIPGLSVPVFAQAEAAPAGALGSPGTPAESGAGIPATASGPTAPATTEYKIRSGDVLSLSVWGFPEFSAESVTVRPDGKISFPTIGDIYVVDRTPLQLSNIIALGIRKYLKDPKVAVTLVSSNAEKYFVTGSVRNPGNFPLTVGTGVREAVIAAGDLAQDANDEAAILIRDGSRIPINLSAAMSGDAQSNLSLKPGDTLTIDRALITFQGEVANTGQQALRRGSTLTQALAAAGGTRDTADIERVQILRGSQTLFANLREIVTDPSKDIALRPDDVIKVDKIDDRTVPAFITGAVGKQGLVRFLPGRRDTLEDAINWAGGATQGADLNRVKLRRFDAQGNQVENTYDLRTVDGRSVRVQANDYIEVPRKKKSNLTGTASSSMGVLLGIASLFRLFGL